MSTVRKPAVGAMVWYFVDASQVAFAGVVTRVYSDSLVNVGGFNADGQAYSATSVPLLQGAGDLARGHFAVFPMAEFDGLSPSGLAVLGKLSPADPLGPVSAAEARAGAS